ncbi:MAG TPA: hypothetical protein VFM05_09690 [Candidatus Saccharimonadales bacterium]|nr:hypothetical protein [Candidatus Saccharimonadales bacterium]
MMDSGLGRIIPGYAVSSLLLTGVVLDRAASLGVHPTEVENNIIKGMFSPDTTGIKMVKRARYGQERWA